MRDPLDPNLMSPAERSRRCATFTVTVVPFITTISWLQSNW